MQRSNGLIKSLILGTITLTSGSTLATLGAASILALAGVATADIKAVEPYFVVVAKDNIPLKCSDGNIYYSVRMLKTGDVLKADGTGAGWLRVEYPAGTKAYVKADEGMFDESAKTLKLNRPSKLMSANIAGARPWWYLLDTDVPAGTVFANAEVVKSADGTVEGYLIAAPAASRGYIREEATRAATAEEANAYKLGSPATTVTTAIKPAPAATPTPTPTPATPTPAIAETPKPAPVLSTPASEATTIVTTTPPSTPATTPTPVTPAATTSSPPTITMTQTPAPSTTTDTSTPTPTTTAPFVAPTATSVVAPTPTKRVEDTETLRTMFDRVMQQPADEAEINTVISEFNRTIDSLGNSDRDASTRNMLSARLQALRLRQDVLDMRRRIAETDTQFSEKTRITTTAIRDVQNQAVYTIVGRIVPSTVYDGRRGMPLMYRVESSDSSSTRTIGYVVPRDGVDMLTKMGKIVGILGESKMDPALGLNIIAPRRVDALEIVGGKVQVVTDTQSTSTTTTKNTTPNGTTTLTTTTTVTSTPQPQTPADQSVPVAQPNEQPDMNK